MTSEDFSRFFQRAREVYGDIPPQRVAEVTANTVRRLAFIGLLANEPDLLYHLHDAILGVSSDGKSFVLDRPVDEAFAPLLRRAGGLKKTSAGPP